jgi:iron complex outermembrane receptor protein
MNKGTALLGAAAALALPAAQGQEIPAPPVPTSVAVPALRPIDAETHTAMYILTRADLARMGDLGLGEVLQRLPFMGRSAFNLNSNAAGDGSVVADIAGMGSSRCIVMLDGQRLPVSELLGAPAVDLDTIPVAAVERVEILLGGASPAWGADAVSGVINIITRPETQGTDITVAGARTSRHDGDAGRVSAFKGEVFGRGHFNISAELRRELPIDSSARAFSAQSEALSCLGSGTTCVWPFGSTATPGGFFVVPAGNLLGLPPGNYTTEGPGKWRPFVSAGPGNDLYSTQTDTFLRDGRTGGSLTASLGYDLSDRTQLAIDVLASKDRVRRQMAPLPLSTTLVGNMAPPQQTAAGVYAATAIPVAGNSFYDPFGVPLSDVRLRLVGLGPRQLVDSSDTEMISGSLRHTSGEWELEAKFSAARSAITEWQSHVINSDRLVLALGGSGPDASGTIRCGTPDVRGIVTTPIPGCVPFDAFDGPSGITPAMLGYIASPSANAVNELEMQFGLLARRSLMISPALPPARLAIGFESLRTAEHADQDDTGLYGVIAGAGAAPTGGTVYENDLLAELSWPWKSGSGDGSASRLTMGARLALAGHYSLVPTAFAALEWRPEPQLLLRSRFTQVYRAPTAGELYLGYEERVLPLGNPCGAGEFASAFCTLANPLHSTAAAAEADYFISGNPHLHPERGFSASWGMVLSSLSHPARLASLDLTWIHLNDAIREPSALELITACEISPGTAPCGRIAFVPNSNIYAVNGSFINGGRDELARIDVKAGDSLRTAFGELRAEILGGYLVRRLFTDVSGHDIDQRGAFDLTQNVTGTAYPLVLSRAQLKWRWGGWALDWNTDFIGSYHETVDRNGFLTSTAGKIRTVGSTIYHDVTLERIWDGLASVRLGVDNLFDRMPPRVNNALEDNTDSATYRLQGRVFSFTLEWTF